MISPGDKEGGASLKSLAAVSSRASFDGLRVIYEPELIRQMSLALENVCAKLALTLTDDPGNRRIASKIIELTQRGVRDAPTLTAMMLNEFEHY
jgi:hypothetical protein